MQKMNFRYCAEYLHDEGVEPMFRREQGRLFFLHRFNHILDDQSPSQAISAPYLADEPHISDIFDFSLDQLPPQPLPSDLLFA